MTICALTYGEYSGLCARLLRSLYEHTFSPAFELRLGLNAPSRETLDVAREFERRHSNVRLTVSGENLFKNPMMRRLLYDEPIETEWTAWFDDDSYVLRADWLHRLAIKMKLYPGVDVWGVRYVLFPDAAALDFARRAPWYRGKPWNVLYNDQGKPAPCFIFPTGGFWVAKTEVLRTLDWPDRRLYLAGEDFLFGEALHQNGFEVGSFERCVAVSDAPRRNAWAPEVTTIPGT